MNLPPHRQTNSCQTRNLRHEFYAYWGHEFVVYQPQAIGRPVEELKGEISSAGIFLDISSSCFTRLFFTS
nr:hypothetical protein HmN_000137900 [Hymenolepis microstoma]